MQSLRNIFLQVYEIISDTHQFCRFKSRLRTLSIIIHQMRRSKLNLTKKNTLFKPLYKENLGVISSGIQRFENASEALIFFTQDFSKCFQEEDAFYPALEKVDFRIGIASKIDQAEMETKVILSIKPQMIQLYILDRLVGTIMADEGQFFIPTDLTGEDPTFMAKKLLSKKIWIKLDWNKNIIEVHVGDFVDPQELQDQNVGKKIKSTLPKHIECPLDPSYHIPDTWKDCVSVYPVNKIEKRMPELSQSYGRELIYYENIFYGRLLSMSRARETEIIQKCNRIQIAPLQRAFNSKISTNSSILMKDPTFENLSEELKSSYPWISSFSLSNLPLTSKLSPSQNKIYSTWKNLPLAINHSIREDYGYQLIDKDGKIVQKPIRILNHLLKIKRGPASFKKIEDKMPWKEKQKIIQENKDVNIRFEIAGNQGMGPGSMAVLEIYPPYTCSPIHNHCETEGLTKVALGEITIENYLDLNFLPDTDAPYMTQTHQKGDISWFNQHSYGIHRVINQTPTTSILIQSYAGKNGSKEYFQFIKKTAEQDYYCQYTPQHDWKDYLSWQPEQITEQTKADLEFINRVKQFYNLQNNGVLDDSFAKFVLVMKEEYEENI